VNLEIAGTIVSWATASPLTVLTHEGRSTLVLIAEDGVPARIAFSEGVSLHAPNDRVRVDGRVLTVDASTSPAVSVVVGQSSLDLLVLSPADGLRAWVLESPDRQLVLAEEAVWVTDDGSIAGRDRAGSARVQRYDLVDVRIDFDNPAIDSALPTTVIRPAGPVGVDAYGEHDRRYSAPTAADRAALAERIRLSLPPAIDGMDAELEVAWEGDIIQVVVDGVAVYDQFWTGQDLVLNLRDVGVTAESDVVLELLPLHPGANVFVSPAAQKVRDRSPSPIGRVHQARLVEPARWHEHA
jgi:hypothetical protein